VFHIYSVVKILDVVLIVSLLLIGSASSQSRDAMKIGATGVVNESMYINTSHNVIAYYAEDLAYSTDIFDKYVAKNISSRDAMVATTSLYSLSSDVVQSFASLNPPIGSDYKAYQQSLLQTWVDFRTFLWFMAKYYETGNMPYISQAQKSVNSSIQNFYKAEGIGNNLSTIYVSKADRSYIDVSKLKGF